MKINTINYELLKKPISLIYRKPGDRIFLSMAVFLGISIVLLTIVMAFVLYGESKEAITRFGVLGFPLKAVWDPAINLEFGALTFIAGTLFTSIGALVLSFVPAVAIAIFTAEYAPRWLSVIVDNLVNLIAAVPSVVVGIWGIFVFTPWMRDCVYMPFFSWSTDNFPALVPLLGNPIGFGMSTATIILALMVLPYTAALTRDAIRLVPREQREASWALGATHREVILMAVLPYSRSGILAGVILSFGRAIGETMAVAMLIGNKNTLPFTLFGPGATMPSVIINEFREAVGNIHYSSLMAVGLALFAISLIVNLLAAWISRKFAFAGGQMV
ncbi:MAG: phosphate ABC transporter permease subunit PstC [Fibrobacter sp.]|nr:phosphate ABC transporter permease subunit PstC [Fibrobacter sp.]